MNSRRTADLAAIVVVLLAGALSAAWALIVPIFQATDEAAHFDYVMSIFGAGRLVSVRDREPVWIATRPTRYLLAASDYFRIAFHSSMKVPPGYGTRAYFRNLDSRGPSIRRPQDEAGKISFVAVSYPFGFYALEAAWIKVIGFFTGSLSAGFFGARLLCVFLTMLGLYLFYRSAVNLGVPPWIGVALVVATGFFPLTTLVSSYVQPDNLAFALVAGSLFFATELRTEARPSATTLALGLCLGALAVTKYHFFLSVAAPIALLVATGAWFHRIGRRAAVARAAALCIPAFLLLAIQFTIVSPLTLKAPDQARYAATTQSGAVAALLSGLLQNGVGPALVQLSRNSVTALIDFFITGPNAASYWAAVGLWDAPIIVVNAQLELLLRAIVSAASAVVAALVVYRIARNLGRLRQIALKGRGRQALHLAFSDPVLNSYALFVLIMFGLYVSTNNALGIVGRHWYPFIFAGFLCAAWYAPRSIRGIRRRAPAILASVMAGYALIASGYATAAVLHRYYGAQDREFQILAPPASAVAPGQAVGALWAVQGMDFHPLFAQRYRDSFSVNSQLWAGGAAIFPDSHRAAEHIAVVIDGHVPAPVLTQQYNFQLAEATHDLTYGYSGFYAPFGTHGLPEGAHFVTAYAQLPQSTLYEQIPPRRSFFLTAGTQFSDGFLRRIARSPLARGRLDRFQSCREDFDGSPEIPTAAPGEILLATGHLDKPVASSSNSIVWLLVDKVPYPAAFDGDSRVFFGAIPASDLSPGAHAVDAYLTTPQTSAYVRIPPTRRFVVSAPQSGSRPRRTAKPLPGRCSEAFHLITGT